jgi:hypothetical protein
VDAGLKTDNRALRARDPSPRLGVRSFLLASFGRATNEQIKKLFGVLAGLLEEELR